MMPPTDDFQLCEPHAGAQTFWSGQPPLVRLLARVFAASEKIISSKIINAPLYFDDDRCPSF
jgi:hypothetical protein